MGVKMNLRITTKNHADDPEIGFLTKSISRPYGRAMAMPTAWELTHVISVELTSSEIYTFSLTKASIESYLNRTYLDNIG